MSIRTYFNHLTPVVASKLHMELTAAGLTIEGVADLVSASSQVGVDFISPPSAPEQTTAQGVIDAHDGIDNLAIEQTADKAAIQQAQADAAIADIGNAIIELDSDYSGWDTMTTADKMLATKRMMARQRDILVRQRKVIKYVRWL